MISLHRQLRTIAETEYSSIVTGVSVIGRRTVGSGKLRIRFRDGSYLDVWVSPSGRYSYHWEQRAQRGRIWRHDNAPDHPEIETFPKHLHDGDEATVRPSRVDDDPLIAIRQLLDHIRQQMERV